MSAGHSEASFNHSCLKVPVDSHNRRPFPKYERLSSADNSSRRKTAGRGPEDEARGGRGPSDKAVEDAVPTTNEDYYDNFKTVKSYLEFYESIPDYTELHHLSNEEFYSRLRTLKITQKRFCDESGVSSDGVFRPGQVADKSDGHNDASTGFYCRTCCGSEGKADKDVGKGTRPKINVISDNENGSEICESDIKKNSDYEADRESSTLQNGEKPSTGNYFTSGREGDGDYLSGTCSKLSRSLPVSSACECECNFRCDCFHNTFPGSHSNRGYSSLSKEKSPGKKHHTRTIPLTSRIPLYDKIMLEKEESFTKREEEERRRLRMVRSNPELNSLTVPTVRFKAKPIPKNLFSNYAYERMKEDEFYRALRRRIRAEELLKSSSLPPSMALRQRKFLSKSLEVFDPDKTWDEDYGGRYRRTSYDDPDFDGKRKSGSASSSSKKHTWLEKKNKRMSSMTDSSTEVSPYESVLSEGRRKTRPRSAFGTGRNNLASVLRIETARKRLEKEMEDKLRENRLRNEARFKARLVRMTPEWRALNHDTEEDLALRVAARREEERMRQESHNRLMESMYGRVYRMPPLFDSERFHSGRNRRTRSPAKCDDSDASPYRQNTDATCRPLEPEPDSESSLPKASHESAEYSPKMSRDNGLRDERATTTATARDASRDIL